MRLGEAFRELLRSGAGKGGVFLLALLLVGALYVLTTYPLDYGSRLWSNPAVWADNPKAAPPVWVNLWQNEPKVEHQVFTARQPDAVKEVKAGKLLTFTFSLAYPYPAPPTFLAVTLGDITFAEKPPLITVSLLRPDGKEVRLLRHAARPARR